MDDMTNSYFEEFDTRTKTFQSFPDQLYPPYHGGLVGLTCLIAMPDQNAIAVTGGFIYYYYTT